MKKQRLTLFVSALLALGLASCGGESSPEPASTPETPASTATKTDTKTTTSKSTTSKSSTSKSTTPAPVARPYIKLPFNSFEGSNYTEESVNKWTKNFTYKWTFWTSRAEEGITVAIGAQLTDGSHSDRSLYTNHEGASSSDSFESNEANDGTPRIVLANNGTASEVTHTTYGDAGLTASELNYFEIGNINVKKGKNVVTITTHAQAGYRLNLGGEIRLLYQVGEESLQGQEVIPTTTISSVAIAAEEEHAYLVYNVDYQNGEFDDVKAMDWQADFEGTTNGGGREWKYQPAADQVLSYADGGEGKLKVKVLLDNLPVNNYWSRFGLGLQPESAGGNAGKANETRFSGEAAAYQNSITVGTRTYAFQADGGDDSYNLPFLKVTDSAEPSYEISEVGMSQVNNRAIITWTISYSNYTLADIQAMDWQAGMQANDNVAHKGWAWADYGAGKDNAIAVVDAGVEGKAKIEIDVTDYDLNCYMAKLGIGLEASGDNAGHAHDAHPTLGQNSSFQIGNKLYEFMPKGINDTFGLPSLFINHAHIFEEEGATQLLNADGKVVTLSACECGMKEITIDYTDGITYGSDGVAKSAVQTKMDKGNHTSWHIAVDQAIENAELYFEGSAGNNNNRYFFNQNKEVNPVNPITNEEYPDDTAGNNADKATEDAWRYMYGVGAVSEENPMQHPVIGTTMAEAGAGQKPMHFGNINLAQGDNVINLYQMNIGFRLTFSGKVHIRYSGAATITGDAIPEPLVPLDRDPVSVAWSTALQSGALSSGKFANNTTYTFSITAPAAAPVVLKMELKGSAGNEARVVNGTDNATKGQGFTITVNGKAATNLMAGHTYGDLFGDQVSWVEVAFAQFEVAEGENTIVIAVDAGGYRLSPNTAGNLVLDYRACLPQ